MANRTTWINAMMRPNMNNSFNSINLPNIVNPARVNRLV